MATLTVLARGESEPRTVEVPDAPPASRGVEAAPSPAAQTSSAPASFEPASSPAGGSSAVINVGSTHMVTWGGLSAPVPSVFGESAGTQAVVNVLGSVFGDSGSAASAADQSYASYGWHVIPSVSNEYSEGRGEDQDFKIDLAGDYQWDWFFA